MRGAVKDIIGELAEGIVVPCEGYHGGRQQGIDEGCALCRLVAEARKLRGEAREQRIAWDTGVSADVVHTVLDAAGVKP